ncbi:MAG: site-specific integrase, partial [Planctomycetaceae bacterium]
MLLSTANKGDVVLGMRGKDRAMLYAVASFTGLRASELASLTLDSFELQCEPAMVTVKAAYSKRRREDELPLHPSLVVQLRPWLADKKPGATVWPGKWAERKYAGKMLQRDLEAAGIPYVDQNGLFADFHSLRHSFITNMVKSGVNPKTAQTLARHSTFELTMNVYTSLSVHDQASALASMPDLPIDHSPNSESMGLAATGTDGQNGRVNRLEKVPKKVPCGAENGAIQLASVPLRSARDCTEGDDEKCETLVSKNAKNSKTNGVVRTRLHQSTSVILHAAVNEPFLCEWVCG